ncbi:unnamed protein product [Heterobilharzia americana]|nr:unnamed protein product [Heterobilharzia americana]
MITQFALVDLRINKFLGSFGRQTVIFSPESTIGKISPDGTYCLVRLPWSRNRRIYILKLYNLRNSELVSELPLSNSSNCDDSASNGSRLPLAPYQEHNRQSNTRTPFDNTFSTTGSVNANFRGNIQNENQLQLGPARSSQVLFAFDPRFVNSRIAITNVDFPHGLNSHKSSSNWVPGIQATLSLVKLPTWECLASTNKLCSWLPSNRPGSPYVNSSSTSRETTRRRRSSDANHISVLPNSNAFSYAFPHIMSVFYSRDGYFLFTITTESRNCRCSVIDNHNYSTSSTPSETPSYIDDISNPLSSCRSSPNSNTESGRNQQRVLSSTQYVESSSRYSSKASSTSPMLAPTLPGCTTLWLTIFNSDTLERLRILRFDRAVCPIHTCPTNYLPVMSRCGSRIALITRQAVGMYSSGINQNTNVNSRECLLASCKTIPASLRHSVPSISIEACYDSHLVNSKNSGPETGKENSGKRVELKKQQALSSQHYFGNQYSSPGNLGVVPICATSSSGVVNIGTSVSNPTVQIDVLLVYQLPPPPKLQALARQRIRQLCKDEHLEQLDLPRRVINYLRFEPSYSCAGSCISRSSSSTRTIRSDSFDM